jgi:transposase
MTADTRRIDLDMKELEAILEQARASLGEEGYQKLKAAIETLDYLTDLIGDKDTTIKRLRQIIFGHSTEKTSNVLDTAPAAASSQQEQAGQECADSPAKEKTQNEDKKRKGHGRNGAGSYTGAEKIKVTHESLKPGDGCPGCLKGKVYGQKVPAVIVRVVGRAPIGATVYELEKLRCNLCGEVFTAAAPEGIGEEKYDETAAGMIALLKYGSGFPFHRLQRLQESMGIPLPASTQWGEVRKVAGIIEPVYEQLVCQAAQGEVLYNDDTSMRILDLMKRRPKPDFTEGVEEDEKTRTGIFTSGIISTRDGREIALFFTGIQYAGENLADLLKKRARELGPPIQMCDGLLSRNLPKEFETILANCNAHARRGFVDLATRFPQECRYVLETFREVYKNDALAKAGGMSAEERLAFHKAETGPLMEKFESWLKDEIAEKKVEPNSGLGQAISYVKNHWRPLTLFLRVPGAPLDNNVCERALKKAILHRKGSLFYKTQNGAHIGDLFMSLIHTCQLGGTDPFDYLIELQRHAEELSLKPQDWMPWNYCETLGRNPPSCAPPSN